MNIMVFEISFKKLKKNTDFQPKRGEKPYKCSKCAQHFSSWDVWNYHKEKCQSAEIFRCDFIDSENQQCEYSTPIKRHLISHKVSVT